MSSYEELLYLKSSEINDRARERDIEGRGSMNKMETVAALADEDLTPIIDMLDQKKSELTEIADDLGLSTDGSKADIQVRIAEAKLTGGSSSGGSRLPEASHFTSVEARLKALKAAGKRAVEKAREEHRSYVILESIRENDKSEPLKMQPAYMKHNEDLEFPVMEIIVPHHTFRMPKN